MTALPVLTETDWARMSLRDEGREPIDVHEAVKQIREVRP